MQDTYWKQFMMSGRIDDYLSYKKSGADKDKKEEKLLCGQNGTERHLYGSETEEKWCRKNEAP